MRSIIFIAAILLLAVVVCCSSSIVSAHKSVRHIKPQTEEAREIHHSMHREIPNIPMHDAAYMASHHQRTDEFHPLDHKHKSNRHKRWGPEHPNHIKTKNWHYKAPRMFKGQKIDDNIHDDDLHLFGLTKHNELR